MKLQQPNKSLVSEAFLDTFNEDMKACIQNCLLCHQLCEHTLVHCLEKEGLSTERLHLRTLLDCAQICSVSADFMLRSSSLHHATCRTCAEVCFACARSCSSYGGDDEMLRVCASICMQCAESCRRMAAHA